MVVNEESPSSLFIMKALTITQILTLLIILLVNVSLHAQQTATAAMNVTVEVVAGSSVELNQNEMITFSKDTPSEVIFARFSISQGHENPILTSSSQSIQMINGEERVEMMTTLTEHQDQNSGITLEFSANSNNHFTNGIYSGKQIAEIIYL